MAKMRPPILGTICSARGFPFSASSTTRYTTFYPDLIEALTVHPRQTAKVTLSLKCLLISLFIFTIFFK
jgi:hypothetical protein